MRNQGLDISSFTLKIVAILGMACNHAAYAFAGLLPTSAFIVLFSLGGVTFPVMAFLLVEGFAHTSNVRKYALRLLVFAIVAQVPYSLLWGAQGNALFTLLVGLGVLYCYERWRTSGRFALALVGAVVATYFCDWGAVGPVLILVFHMLRDQGTRGIALAMLVLFLGHTLPALYDLTMGAAGGEATFSSIAGNAFLGRSGSDSDISSLLIGDALYSTAGFAGAFLLLLAYRGRRGKSLKWLFYAFYPAHLFVIWLLKLILGA